ncbi:hypothetical protein FHS85_003253 [Rhodoligotrophos appendicifer]|uniref:hypothetical protein n=1 Tax=Rhodoligotrophos appendicifer TaxID=987056 RepID=UPI0011853161|nr:hypothetical protein [Rhodoligotrophos appendicifer]
MKLELIIGDTRLPIACEGARAPKTLALLERELPMPVQLHTPKIAGSHIYWHAPIVADLEAASSVMDAPPGAFLYWPERQFLELIFAPLQAETASVTQLGHMESGLDELKVLGAILREKHGQQLFEGELRLVEGNATPSVRREGRLAGLRRKVWEAAPTDIDRLMASRSLMHPAGPLFVAEAEARCLHELLWSCRQEARDPRHSEQSRFAAALACGRAATRLRGFCHLDECADVVETFAVAFRDSDPTPDLFDEAIMSVGRIAAWLDLRIPWNQVNEAIRSRP